MRYVVLSSKSTYIKIFIDCIQITLYKLLFFVSNTYKSYYHITCFYGVGKIIKRF